MTKEDILEQAQLLLLTAQQQEKEIPHDEEYIWLLGYSVYITLQTEHQDFIDQFFSGKLNEPCFLFGYPVVTDKLRPDIIKLYKEIT